jgi:hypothetical protein
MGTAFGDKNKRGAFMIERASYFLVPPGFSLFKNMGKSGVNFIN